MLEPLIVLAGPTAIGKTALSLPLAQALNAEIVNVDSRQLYRCMDIGTAKPTPVQQTQVPHHALDLLWPDEKSTAAHFLAVAREAISSIVQRGRRVLLVAGSGLYLQALLYGLMPAPPAHEPLRVALRAYADQHGMSALHQRLRQVDPQAAAWYHPHDRTRVVRALEVTYLTGTPFSVHCQQHQNQMPVYPYIGFSLDRERADLYRRIAERTEAMVATGWLAEIDGLITRGYTRDCAALDSLGYRELLTYMAAEAAWEATIATIKKATRRLAKRQLTWFRKFPHLHGYDLTNLTEAEAVADLLERLSHLLAHQHLVHPGTNTLPI